MTRASPEPDPALEELRAEYARALPGKLHELRCAVEDARARPGDALLMGTARLLAHRLCGTAGSYGFAAVGEACGRVEDALERLARCAPHGASEAWSEAVDGLAAAEAIAGRVAG